MTATQTNTFSQPMTVSAFDKAVPVKITFAPNWPARIVLLKAIGLLMIVSVLALWFMPGSTFDADMLPFKAVPSMLVLAMGTALLTLKHVNDRPDAYFDPIRREVRVLQKNENGRPHTVLRRGYETLGGARFSDKQVELFDLDGSLLMKLPLASKEVANALKGQLSGSIAIAA